MKLTRRSLIGAILAAPFAGVAGWFAARRAKPFEIVNAGDQPIRLAVEPAVTQSAERFLIWTGQGAEWQPLPPEMAKAYGVLVDSAWGRA